MEYTESVIDLCILPSSQTIILSFPGWLERPEFEEDLRLCMHILLEIWKDNLLVPDVSRWP